MHFVSFLQDVDIIDIVQWRYVMQHDLCNVDRVAVRTLTSLQDCIITRLFLTENLYNIQREYKEHRFFCRIEVET